MRSRSVCLGPVRGGDDNGGGGFIRSQLTRKHGLDWEAVKRQQIELMDAADARHAAHAAHLFDDIGLKMPASTSGPIDKPPSVVDLADPAAAPNQAVETEVGQEDAPLDGEADVSGTQGQ